MANFGRKAGVYYVRIRFQGNAYKRSIKSCSRADAEAAKRSVEQTLHRLLFGLIAVPSGVNARDFIVSGGMLQEGPTKAPPIRHLIERDLSAQQAYLAESTHGLIWVIERLAERTPS